MYCAVARCQLALCVEILAVAGRRGPGPGRRVRRLPFGPAAAYCSVPAGSRPVMATVIVTRSGTVTA